MMKIATLTGGPFAVSCYLLKDEATGDAAFIDSGDGTLALDALAKKLDATPKMVLLTHGHIDHAGGLARVRREFPEIPILLHDADRFWVDSLAAQGSMFGFDVEPAPPPGPQDRSYREGETIAIGRDLKLKVLFTPGHSAGGVTFRVEGEPLAFVGDTLFQGSIGRTDLPGGDFRTLIRSIREKIFPLGDDVECHSGHGPVTTVGRERKHNPFLRPGNENENENDL